MDIAKITHEPTVWQWSNSSIIDSYRSTDKTSGCPHNPLNHLSQYFENYTCHLQKVIGPDFKKCSKYNYPFFSSENEG